MEPQFTSQQDLLTWVINDIRRFLLLPNPIFDRKIPVPKNMYLWESNETLIQYLTRNWIEPAVNAGRIRGYDYDPDTELLTLLPLSRPIHDTAWKMAEHFHTDALVTGFLPGKLVHRLPWTGTNSQAPWTKQCEVAFVFNDAPVVVFQVGLSTLVMGFDLVDEAHQWLTLPLQPPRLVVTIDIREDTNKLKAIQAGPQYYRRLRQLVRNFGPDSGSAMVGGMQRPTQEDSNMRLSGSLKDAIHTSDWVGPLSVQLEMWHVRDGMVEMRGPPITVLPKPTQPSNPTIKITDIIPESHHSLIADLTSTMALDMDAYREYLVDGTRNLAYLRALDTIRPQDW